MLISDFYQIFEFQQPEANVVNAVVGFNPDHPVFGGHFPDMPIVPGVCSIQVLKEMLEMALGRETMLIQADHIKYLSFIRPEFNKEVAIALKYQIDEMEIIGVTGQLGSEGSVLMKFQGKFKFLAPE